MKISMAVIADEANISQEGKLNLLGAFDRIDAVNFPVVHPKMVFVFRVEAGYQDSGGTAAVRVRLMDADGAVLFEAGGEIGAPEVRPGGFATAYQLFTLAGIQFREPGLYKFVISLGDMPPHETPLQLVKNGWGSQGQQLEN